MCAAVITGMGCISPHGRGVSALWSGLLAGKTAFSAPTLFDASMFRNPLAGVVDGYPASKSAAEPTRAVRMLNDAAAEALADALGLSGSSESMRESVRGPSGNALRQAAIITGTNFGGMSAAEDALVGGADDISKASLDGYLFGAASAGLAREFSLRGSQFNISLACASGTAAIGMALDLIRQGRAEAVLACGYDELSLFIYAGLSALRAITPETLRPFDKRRKGTLFSEGAGAMLIESEEHAKARNAPHVYARVLGRFMNNDAYHMTAPEQEAHGGIQAVMRGALSDAKISPRTAHRSSESSRHGNRRTTTRLKRKRSTRSSARVDRKFRFAASKVRLDTPWARPA